MESFYIDAGPRQVFATLLGPRVPEKALGAILLCYPFGQEYLRAHRAYRQLATLLSRAGFHVMRFDYPGAGDSFGDQLPESFQQLTAELAKVAACLVQRSGRQKITIGGLRFGGLVAAALAESQPCCERLLLWDSYSCGSEFNEDCLQQLEGGDSAADADTWYVHGFPLQASFRDSIAKFDLTHADLDEQLHIQGMLSHENSYSERLQQHFSQGPQRFSSDVVPSNGDWNYVDRDGSILIPSQLIRQIAAVLKEDASR